MILEARRIEERPVQQREFGLLAALVVSEGAQFDVHRGLVTSRIGVIAVGVMGPGEDQPLRTLDLEVFA